MSKRELTSLNDKEKDNNKETLIVKSGSSVVSSYKIKGPDFRKIAPREKFKKVGKNKRLFPFLEPNYELTMKSKKISIYLEPINFIKFDKMLERKEKSNKNSYENHSDYDPDKIMEKVNNHKRVLTPNFNKMNSRTIDGPYPFYMQV